MTINELVGIATGASEKAVKTEKDWRDYTEMAAKAGAVGETKKGAALWEISKAAAIAEREAWKAAKAAAPQALV